ncbi:hypothetical protein [Bradyrhizobium sediminis]|uniref:hypothetical protein n=1 Tax=Bradyrhizobium sediminis TaxID=2840469 RepID=UPI00352D340A
MTGLAGLAKLAGFRGSSVGPEGKTFTPGFVCVLAILIAGLGAWVLSGNGSNTAESEPAPSPSADLGLDLSLPNQAATPADPPIEAAPVDGLRIASQSWRRGGLGSKALVTLTLRNGNDYAVKDIEIFCSFARRDGSHLTDRKRIIPDIIAMKSRKTFARLHVGFVNISANQAKCSLVTASRI